MLRLQIQIEVNDVPVKGMKMRLGRAGEGYFVAETTEPPPPEFRASIDPDAGLSDDESYNLEPRATHDDWAEQDEQQARVVDMMVEPPAEAGNWGDVLPAAAANLHDERAHLRLRSADNASSANAADNRKGLRSSSSAQSVLTHPSSALTSSGEQQVTEGKPLKTSNGGREVDFDRRSDDGRVYASVVSDLDPSPESSSYEHLTSSDPIILASQGNKASDGSISLSSSKKSSTTAAKPAGKSWGLSLFGFLGKKEPKEQPQAQAEEFDDEDDDDDTLLRPSGHPPAASGRRTSLDLPDNGSRPLAIEASAAQQTSFTAAASNDASASRHVQSSSLPNHWGPSPLAAYVPSEPEEPVAEEKSRPAEDGSGVIYLGQKKKPRSSSITSSSSMGNTRVGSDANATAAKSKSGAHSPNVPLSTSPAPGSISPTLAINNANNANNMSVTDSLTSTGGRKINTSDGRDPVQVSSPDSDEEYQDMVFEMDEEAYAAANPSINSSSTQSPHFGMTSPTTQHGASTSSSGASPSPSPTTGPGSSFLNNSSGHVATSSHNPASTSTSEVATSHKQTFEASRCGMQAVANADNDPQAANEAFRAARLSYAALNDDPSIIFGPDVVFRLGGAYYPIQTAGPLLFSVALFNESLSAPALERLLHQQVMRGKQSATTAAQRDGTTGSIGKAWGRLMTMGGWGKPDSEKSGQMHVPTSSKSDPRNSASPPIGRANDRASRSSTTTGNATIESGDASYINATHTGGPLSPKPQRQRSGSKGPGVRVGGLTKETPAANEGDLSTGPQSLFHGTKDASSGVPGAAGASRRTTNDGAAHSTTHSKDASSAHSAHNKTAAHNGPYYVRTLKPTSDKLKALGLKPGANKIVFRVDSRLQGSQQLSSTVYLWDREAKVVISDIDGTITKSDVLGQIFPVFGKDWSHMGVAQLFQSIKANGYEILYLTARAIGAASITKGFLTSLQQGSVRLPDGPVFMSPDRLLYSLNREVILRKPEEFKIQCLGEIKSLFLASPTEKSPGPFYAGFGNRETDALSYVAVGIPAGKTFTINPSGEITGHSKSIQRTYTKINELVEQMFPAYHKKKSSSAAKPAEQWNDFQFWETRPAYSFDDLEKELLK